MHDYSGYQPKATEEFANRLIKMVLELERVDEKVEELRAQLKQAEATADALRETDIPSLMKQARQTDCTIDGINVKVEKKIRANIKNEDREEVYSWFEANGFGKLIKRKFTILFGRDDEQWAAKFERDLEKRKRPLEVERTKDVHHSTLEKFARSQLEAGKKMHEKIGIYEQPFVKISRK